jgi:hypothetical protein
MAETYMDTDRMKVVATGFDGVGTALRVVSMALEAAIMTLKAAAFISLGATVWLERYLSNIKPKVDALGKKCDELGSDINNSIQLHQQASQSGSGGGR